MAAVRTLDGVNVLDFGMNIAGPQAASLLADLGANVIKVEAPGGDTSRSLAPRTDGVGAMFATVNRNKRYLGLDLSAAEARSALIPMFTWADVVVQNLRPGKAEALGIAAAQCHAVNPRIIHISIEAFYPEEMSRPGYDLLVQAETGMMSLTGDPDRSPSRLPGSILDHVTGLWAAFGVVAALRGDRNSCALQLTMSDVAMGLLGDRVTSYLVSGEAPTRLGSATGVTTPLQAYPTADADIVVGAVSDPLFQRLAAEVTPELVGDPDYANQASRLEHRDQLNEHLTRSLTTASASSWLDRFEAAGIPAARIRDLADATDRHRKMSRTGLHVIEGLPTVELVANPLGADTDQAVARPRGVGADSREILTGTMGLSAEQYQALVAARVVPG